MTLEVDLGQADTHPFLQGVDNEQAVSEILECGEKRQNIVSLLYEYMNLLDIQGIGLVEATDRNPSIGHIVGEHSLYFCRVLYGLSRSCRPYLDLQDLL